MHQWIPILGGTSYTYPNPQSHVLCSWLLINTCTAHRKGQHNGVLSSGKPQKWDSYCSSKHVYIAHAQTANSIMWGHTQEDRKVNK